MEEANMYGDANHLDADARLPPRKRLLAGMKKQNSDCPSPSSSPLSGDMSNRIIRDLLNGNCNGSNMSAEDIVKASRSAALAAAKVAAAARAAAVEKAAVAAKAVAAAKSALELVAKPTSRRSRKERGLRKDKQKKHVPVQLLYKKRKRGLKGETDEELARRLHRVINSSPRISKNSTSPDQKGHRRKHRKQLRFDETVVTNGGSKPPSTCNVNVDTGDSVQGEDDKASGCTKTDCVETNSLNVIVDGEASPSSLQVLEDMVSTARKRGRIKQKKLSLSLCAVRDRENTKEEPKSKGKPSATDDPLSSPEIEASNEAVSTWPRKELSASQCYARSNNILGSLCSNPTVTTGSAMVEVDQ